MRSFAGDTGVGHRPAAILELVTIEVDNVVLAVLRDEGHDERLSALPALEVGVQDDAVLGAGVDRNVLREAGRQRAAHTRACTDRCAPGRMACDASV